MRSGTFYGWRVVAAAFGLAILGLGFGFYGPPIILNAVRETRGWPLSLVSTAVTVHFLVGSIATANLPTIYRRLGIPIVKGRRAVAGLRCAWMGDGGNAVATVRCDAAERCRLGDDGRRRAQRHRIAGSLLWRDRRFLTLAAGMSLGLCAQIGLTAHLFSLLLPVLGPQSTGRCWD